MSNKELIAKIKGEIDVRYSEYRAKMKSDDFAYYEGMADSLDLFEQFIDTLESEKPMNLDLEIEIEDYVEQMWQFAEDLNAAVPIYLYDMTLNELKDCARHFAKWGAEHAKIDVTDFCKPIDPGIAQCIADHSWEMLGEDEKPVPNDLEEAAKKYATEWHENPDGSAWKPYFEVSAIKAFIAGAKWQKDQDDKELSDLLTIAHLQGADQMKEKMLKEAVEGVAHPDDCEIWVNLVGYGYDIKDGDKVRIIVCKNED